MTVLPENSANPPTKPRAGSLTAGACLVRLVTFAPDDPAHPKVFHATVADITKPADEIVREFRKGLRQIRADLKRPQHRVPRWVFEAIKMRRDEGLTCLVAVHQLRGTWSKKDADRVSKWDRRISDAELESRLREG